MHRLGAAVVAGLDDLDLLRGGDPLRIGGEVGDDRHDVGGGRIDGDRLGGLVGHGQQASRSPSSGEATGRLSATHG